MPYFVATLETPIGPLTATVDAAGRLARLAFPGERPFEAAAEDPERCAPVFTQLAEYLAGARRKLTVPLAARGTPFQHRVWDELRRIPYGTTISYRELATRVGNPAACRAVARANATNPVPIIVPCHRVIGADGSLTGYGGGIDRKRFLLALEGVVVPPTPAPRATAPLAPTAP
jgi:methylated-DNA-[protein]-cysteine S-methyltransferase